MFIRRLTVFLTMIFLWVNNVNASYILGYMNQKDVEQEGEEGTVVFVKSENHGKTWSPIDLSGETAKTFKNIQGVAWVKEVEEDSKITHPGFLVGQLIYGHDLIAFTGFNQDFKAGIIAKSANLNGRPFIKKVIYFKNKYFAIGGDENGMIIFTKRADHVFHPRYKDQEWHMQRFETVLNQPVKKKSQDIWAQYLLDIETDGKTILAVGTYKSIIHPAAYYEFTVHGFYLRYDHASGNFTFFEPPQNMAILSAVSYDDKNDTWATVGNANGNIEEGCGLVMLTCNKINARSPTWHNTPLSYKPHDVNNKFFGDYLAKSFTFRNNEMVSINLFYPKDYDHTEFDVNSKSSSVNLTTYKIDETYNTIYAKASLSPSKSAIYSVFMLSADTIETPEYIYSIQIEKINHEKIDIRTFYTPTEKTSHGYGEWQDNTFEFVATPYEYKTDDSNYKKGNSFVYVDQGKYDYFSHK